MGYSSKRLELYDNDIGKKVFTIKEEKTIVIEYQIKAKDEDEAFDKWLDAPKDETMEDHKVRDNSDDVVCTYAKEYSDLKEGTRELGTIKREDPDDEESDLEVA
tara:strand:- start:196 stop:507 length:312 start_codon:yes stop_codon:yes gene_type:complete